MHFIKSKIWLFGCLFVVMNMVRAEETDKAAGNKSQTSKQSVLLTFEKLLSDADSLIKSAKSADAYAMLEPLQFEHAGEIRFDYLLGVAALDSGKADKATLAFERVLAVNPNMLAARLDMARAYYQLGDFVRASAEFELTLKQNPPEAARGTIQKYLDAIAAKDPARLTQITGYLEAALGHDSNVNNSFDKPQTRVFDNGVFYPASISPTNLKSQDNYYGLSGGAEVNHRLNNNWGVYAGAGFRQRGYLKQTNFTSQSLSAQTGLVFATESNRLRTGVQIEEFSLGNARNRGTIELNADWAHKLSPANQLNVFAQYEQYRFAEAVMEINNFNQQAIGTGLTHVLGEGKASLSASLYTGSEADVAAGGRLDGAKRFNGLRVTGVSAYGDQTVLFANAGAQVGEYNKTNIYYQLQRSEKLYDFTLGAAWSWNKLWIVRPQISYTQSNSNIEIYSYTRTDASVSVRRDFK